MSAVLDPAAPASPPTTPTRSMSRECPEDDDRLERPAKRRCVAVNEGPDELQDRMEEDNNDDDRKQHIRDYYHKHIPIQYSTVDEAPNVPKKSSRAQQYCRRHDPRLRRKVDEVAMEVLQNDLESIPPDDRQAVSNVWSLFSAAPHSIRMMMLQGIMQKSCGPQLSYISSQASELLRVDFVSLFPEEITTKIFGYLDCQSLCRSMEVSRKWHRLANDTTIWHRLCNQHIDRTCKECGWGLPALERKKIQAVARDIEENKPYDSPSPEAVIGKPQPWKNVFSERYRVESNWRKGRCTKRVLKGHTSGILCVKFDGEVIASGSYDKTIRIWDMETGEHLRTLTGHRFPVRCLQFDETKLISGDLNGEIRIWNYRVGGAAVHILKPHEGPVIGLNFDGNLLATGGADHTINIIDLKSGEQYTLRGHKEFVNDVRINQKNMTLFSASDDMTVRLWDLKSRICIRSYEGHVAQVQQVVPVRLRDWVTPASCEDDLPLSPSPSPTPPDLPDILITCALDASVRYWDPSTGRPLEHMHGHFEGIWGLAADCLRLVTASHDGMVKVWNTQTRKHIKTICSHEGPVTCVDLSDEAMATGSEDSEVHLFNFKCLGDPVKGWRRPPHVVGRDKEPEVGPLPIQYGSDDEED